MILVSRSIRKAYMRIFDGVTRGGGIKGQWGCRRRHFLAGAEQRHTRLANAVLANGSDNRVVVAAVM